MTCGHCQMHVQKAFKAVAGVGDVVVSLEEKKAQIEYDENQTSPEKIASALDGTSYTVHGI